MAGRKTTFNKKMAASLRWLGLFLALLYAYWLVMTNLVVRDFWDPPYVTKSEVLFTALKENPGRPLWLVLGSSRVDNGLRPDALLATKQPPDAPLIFNFGMGGADLYRQGISLKRLLAAGVKPRRVCIEIVGAMMFHDGEGYADDARLAIRARRDELDDLCAHAAKPGECRETWMRSRFNPFYQYGMVMPGQSIALRLVPGPFLRRFESRPFDRWGWFMSEGGMPQEEVYKKGFAAEAEFERTYLKSNMVSAKADADLRSILDLCKREGVQAILLRMPEDRDFQQIYPPMISAAMDAYIKKIEDDYQVRMLDARSWYLERDNFTDGHHLNAMGAVIFTVRFAEELSKL